MAELEQNSKERVLALEQKFVDTEAAHEKKLNGYIETLSSKQTEFETQLKIAKNKEIELIKRISALSSTENELREKVHTSEKEFGERLRTAANRERELIDKINLLNKQLEQINKDAEDKERVLEEKLNLSQDEIVVLRNSKNSVELQQLSSPTSAAAPAFVTNQPRMLQEEIESLRCVLELKQREISELRKQNNELQTASDALPSALIKISGLESRLEDLKIQLKAKCEDEK